MTLGLLVLQYECLHVKGLRAKGIQTEATMIIFIICYQWLFFYLFMICPKLNKQII